VNQINPDSPTRGALVTEAIRLVEERGALDDAAALREAQPAHADMPARIAHRARVLGQRIGMLDELARARLMAPWVGIGLVLVIVFGGLALAGSVVGAHDRRINVMAALLSLLGFHALTLLTWLVAVFTPMGRGAMSHASLGGLWMALTARVAGGRHGQAPVLLRAATRLLARARLVPWAAGIASHGIWTLSFVVVLAALFFTLSFHRYTLSWETTILDPQVFVRMAEVLGRAPAWLGFPVPSASMPGVPGAGVTADGTDLAGQRAWALWLMGCIVVYGLLPRVLLLALSLAVWRWRRHGFAPDLSLPYYRRLIERFEALAPPDIVDADPGVVRPAASHRSPGPARATGSRAISAFELAGDMAWPPAGLPADVAVLPASDGSAPGRRQLLDAVARLRPATLVVAVRAVSSPDRGTERLLRELGSHCGQLHLWLARTRSTPRPGDEAAGARWHRWLVDTGLGNTSQTDTPDHGIIVRAFDTPAEAFAEPAP
jgi:hypothetical protein